MNKALKELKVVEQKKNKNNKSTNGHKKAKKDKNASATWLPNLKKRTQPAKTATAPSRS